MYVPDVVLRNYSEKELFFWSSNLTGHPVFLAKSGSPVLGSSTSFLHYTSSWFSVALSFILSHSLIISLCPLPPPNSVLLLNSRILSLVLFSLWCSLFQRSHLNLSDHFLYADDSGSFLLGLDLSSKHKFSSVSQTPQTQRAKMSISPQLFWLLLISATSGPPQSHSLSNSSRWQKHRFLLEFFIFAALFYLQVLLILFATCLAYSK